MSGLLLDDQTGYRRYERADLASVNEVRTALSIGRSTVYEMLGCGQLRSFKLDGRRFIEISELHQLLNPAGVQP